MSEWRDIPGYDGMYQVSRDGMIRSWRKPLAWEVRADKPRMMSAYVRGGKRYGTNHTGRRYCVNLVKDGKRIERTISGIMAEVWLGGRPKGLVMSTTSKVDRFAIFHNCSKICMCRTWYSTYS